MSKPDNVYPPTVVETAAFSVRDGALKVLVAGEGKLAYMPWQLGVTPRTLERDPETRKVPRPHELAMRGVRLAIVGHPHLPIALGQVGSEVFTEVEEKDKETDEPVTETIVCMAHLALIPPITGEGFMPQHVEAKGTWVNPDYLLREAKPAKESHFFTVLEAFQELYRVAKNGWRDGDLTPLAALSAPEFTVGDLRRIAQAVFDEKVVKLDPRNFARKARNLGGLVDTGAKRQGDTGKPATVYTYQTPPDSQWPRKSWPYS